MDYSFMATLEELKTKSKITREDIANLLKEIGEPGQMQDVKRETVAELNKANFQGIKLETTIEEYQEY